MNRVLVVTNDFPPRQGGIQSFVHELVLRRPPGSVVVYASDHAGSAPFDGRQPFPVLRHPTGLLVPTPSAQRRVTTALREFECDSVWFGAAAPLGLLAPALRRAGARRIVATTHGHEAGWAMLPGARQMLRRIADGCDTVTYLNEYFRSRLAPLIDGRAGFVPLRSGVDADAFRPGIDATGVRQRFGLVGRPVVVCVSRLVARKGQDVLVQCWPTIRRAVPGAALLLVGEGPYRDHLEKLARAGGVERDVIFTGPIATEQLPQHYAAGDVFAMPCRTRRAGMDVEGLGIVFLEASATGLPVVVGDSGGSPDAVRDGETGYLVDGRDEAAVTARIIALLSDRAAARSMGAAGRAWIERDWRWQDSADRLGELLEN